MFSRWEDERPRGGARLLVEVVWKTRGRGLGEVEESLRGMVVVVDMESLALWMADST